MNAENMPVVIQIADPYSQVARQCIQAYFEELSLRLDQGFNPSLSVSAQPEELIAPVGYLLLAYIAYQPVGCVALKVQSTEKGEIKRMWVAPSVRGKSVAQQLLEHIESLAYDAGIRTLQLDTHRNLVEARAFYKRNGYREIPAYNDNPYAHYWFEKHLV